MCVSESVSPSLAEGAQAQKEFDSSCKASNDSDVMEQMCVRLSVFTHIWDWRWKETTYEGLLGAAAADADGAGLLQQVEVFLLELETFHAAFQAHHRGQLRPVDTHTQIRCDWAGKTAG